MELNDERGRGNENEMCGGLRDEKESHFISIHSKHSGGNLIKGRTGVGI